MTPTDRPLRIAIVHSFYRSEMPSGENTMVEAELAALRRAGHTVELFAAHLDAEVTGPLDRAAVFAAMREATGLIFPSICLEAAPLVYLEALAVGLPVVAFEPSGPAEAIARDGTGVVARWDRAAIAAALEEVRERRGQLYDRCRAVFEAHHTETAFVERRTDLYRSLLTISGGKKELPPRWRKP